MRIIEANPTWGYQIKKQVEAKLGTKVRHGALYPLLNSLERKGFLTSELQLQGKRRRKIYSATRKGQEYIEAYNAILKEQLEKRDIK